MEWLTLAACPSLKDNIKGTNFRNLCLVFLYVSFVLYCVWIIDKSDRGSGRRQQHVLASTTVLKGLTRQKFVFDVFLHDFSFSLFMDSFGRFDSRKGFTYEKRFEMSID